MNVISKERMRSNLLTWMSHSLGTFLFDVPKVESYLLFWNLYHRRSIQKHRVQLIINQKNLRKRFQNSKSKCILEEKRKEDQDSFQIQHKQRFEIQILHQVILLPQMTLILLCTLLYVKGNDLCYDHPIGNFISNQHLYPKFRASVLGLSVECIPSHISNALKDSKWKTATMECMHLIRMKLEILLISQGKVFAGCKSVNIVKYNHDGMIQRYKARLVAEGFTRSSDMDYFETFPPQQS